MSLSADEIVADQSLMNYYYTMLVQFTFVTYDWAITFDQEVNVMWRDFNKASVLFLINRYSQFLLVFAQLAMYFGPQYSTAYITST